MPCPSSSSLVFKPNQFKGKVLFCTGGRSGIGYDIVELLMSLGCVAAIVGRDGPGLKESASKLQSSTGNVCLGLAADVRKPDQLKKAVEDTVKHFGGIDWVVCAAAGNFLSPIQTMSENAFKIVIEIDLLGTFNTIKATLPYIKKSMSGSYVHISATLHYRATQFQAHVSAAKAGVDALSAVLAVEVGPLGIRSNIIAPGPIADTAGAERLAGTEKEADLIKSVPLQRLGKGKDIANMAAFLFSDAASYITGQKFVVDGGWEMTRVSSLAYPGALLELEERQKNSIISRGESKL